MKKLSATLAAILFALILLFCLSADNQGFVLVQNNSTQPVEFITIHIKDLNFSIANLEQGAQAGKAFMIHTESHYDVNATFSSGKTISLSSGYLTNGIDSYDLFIITDDSILHERIPHIKD